MFLKLLILISSANYFAKASEPRELISKPKKKRFICLLDVFPCYSCMSEVYENKWPSIYKKPAIYTGKLSVTDPKTTLSLTVFHFEPSMWSYERLKLVSVTSHCAEYLPSTFDFRLPGFFTSDKTFPIQMTAMTILPLTNPSQLSLALQYV